MLFNRFTFMPIHRHVQKNKFLPFDTYMDIPYWSGTDTKELYQQNLKKQPKDWIYRTKEVRYTANSCFYRTKEFKDIAWAESVVIFGCSHAYGIGLDDSDTIAAKLEKIIDRPVINMGSGGTSMTYALHNSSILHEGYPTPKAVVYVWPDYSRTIEYKRHQLVNYGPWNMEPNSIMDVWNREKYHARTSAVFIQKLARAMWRERTTMYEATFSDATDRILHCSKFKEIDYARDLCHPGIGSAELAAEQIARDIKL